MTEPSNNPDPEELLKQSKEQTRHTSEPSTTPESTADTVDRVTAIKEALQAIEDDDAPENINLRDARLKALLVGLDAAGELDDIAIRLVESLDSETDIDLTDTSQSDVARLLLRVGLQEAIPDVLDDATEARRERAIEQAETF